MDSCGVIDITPSIRGENADFQEVHKNALSVDIDIRAFAVDADGHQAHCYANHSPTIAWIIAQKFSIGVSN